MEDAYGRLREHWLYRGPHYLFLLRSYLPTIEAHIAAQTLLEKAFSHFRLEDTADEYALMVTMDGYELEASDDMLDHLPHMARITLQTVSEEEEDGYSM